MQLFELFVTIGLKDSEFNKGINNAMKKGEGFGASFGKVAAGVGKAAATGLAVAGAAFTGLSIKALQLGGALEQNVGGAEAVFDSFADTVQDKAVKSFELMGTSTSDYLATANKLGALMKGAGYETEAAMNLSADVMQRAADVAALMGISTADALHSVTGAAKGNYTMMDNLGVAMNATTIEAYALSKGIDTAFQNMTMAEKTGLAMEMFLEKTAYAAGRYAKENETLAGALGTAGAAMKNFLDGSGDVDQLVTAFSNAANVIVGNLQKLLPRLTEGIGEILSKLAPKIPDMLGKLLPSIIKGTQSLLNGLMSAMPKLISVLANTAPKIIKAAVELAGKFVKGLADGIRKNAKQLIQVGKDIISALAEGLGDLIPALKPITGAISLLAQHIEGLMNVVIPATAVFLAFKAATSITAILTGTSQAMHLLATGTTLAATAETKLIGTTMALGGAKTALGAITGILTGKISLATAAQWLWNTAILANPIGVTIGLIAGLTAVVVILMNSTEEMTEAEIKRKQSMEKSIERTNELADAMRNQQEAYESNIESIQNSTSAKLAEIDYTKTLADELMTLADGSGKVDEANKVRVAFILGELNDALGTEYSMTGNIINGYKDMVNAIQETIQKEKERIVLGAFKEEMEASIKAETEARKNMIGVLEQQRQKQELAVGTEQEYIKRYEEMSKKTLSLAEARKQLTGEEEFALGLAAGQKLELSGLKQEYEEYTQQLSVSQESLKLLGKAIESEINSREKYEKAALLASEGRMDELISSLSTSAETLRVIEQGSADERINAIINNNAIIEDLEKKKNEALNEETKTGIEAIIKTLDEENAKLVKGYEEAGDDAVTGLGNSFIASGYAENAAGAMAQRIIKRVKREFDEHSPSRVFRDEIGAMIVAGLAEGISENEQEAIKAAEKMSKNVLNASIKWIDDYSHLNKLSASEEIEIWQATLENHELLMEERLEINKKIHTLEEIAQRDAFNSSKKWIDAQKFYSLLSIEEEIAAYERMAVTHAENAEFMEEIDRNLYALRNNLRENDFENSQSWIARMKFFGMLSAQDEIDAWERVTKKHAEGTREREEAERNLFNARKQLLNETQALYDKMQAAEDKYTAAVESRAKQIFNSFGLFDELTKKSRMVDVTTTEEFKKQSEERLGILKEEFNERENVSLKALEQEFDKRKKAIENAYISGENMSMRQEELQRLTDAYEADKKAITNSLKKELAASEVELLENLKADAQAKQGTLKDVLTKNLKDQVAEMHIWTDNISKLANKGIDKGFISELEAMGPAANEELEALNSMTNSELNEYVGLWQEKQRIAHNQATKELRSLRSDTDAEIKGLMSDLEEITQNRAGDIGQNMISKLGQGIMSQYETLKTQMQTLAQGVTQVFQDNFMKGVNVSELLNFGMMPSNPSMTVASSNMFNFNNSFPVAQGISQKDANWINQFITNQLQIALRARGM